jgi:hypothetical protein
VKISLRGCLVVLVGVIVVGVLIGSMGHAPGR